MAVAAYTTVLSLPGTSTALVNEAMTVLTASLVFQITNAAHQALDPTVAVVVQVSPDNSTWSAPTGTYAIDYTAGVVTFASSQSPNTFCRVQSGSYIPLLPVASAKKFSVAMKLDVADTTIFGATAHGQLGLLDSATASFDQFDNFHADYANSTYDGVHRLFDDLYVNGSNVFLFIQPGGAGNQAFRGWMKINALDDQGDVTDVIKGTVSLMSTSIAPSSPGANEVGSRVNFSWR